MKRLAARSAGRPIVDAQRAEMEEALDYDFSRVRVHTDDAAGEVAEVMAADAVTMGNDIYFAEGAYRPGDPVGTELLAHELVHVARNGGEAEAGPEARISDPAEPMEQEAAAAGREAVRGGPSGGLPTALVDGAARRIALRATRPLRPDPAKGPSLPLGEKRIVDRLAGIILGDFWKDPDDRAGRVRGTLARLSEKTRVAVAEVIHARLGDADIARFTKLISAGRPPGTDVETPHATADDLSREQRQERTEEENAGTRNREAGADEAHDPGEETARAPDEAQPEAGEAEDGTAGTSLLGALSDALERAFGLKTKKPRETPSDQGGKAKPGEKDGKTAEKDPEKPSVKNGEGTEGQQQSNEKPEVAEVEMKQGGAGEAERPGGGSPPDAPVDTGPFDRLLAAPARARPAAPGAGMRAMMGAGAMPAGPEMTPAGGEAGGAETGPVPGEETSGAPEEAMADAEPETADTEAGPQPARARGPPGGADGAQAEEAAPGAEKSSSEAREAAPTVSAEGAGPGADVAAEERDESSGAEAEGAGPVPGEEAGGANGEAEGAAAPSQDSAAADDGAASRAEAGDAAPARAETDAPPIPADADAAGAGPPAGVDAQATAAGAPASPGNTAAAQAADGEPARSARSAETATGAPEPAATTAPEVGAVANAPMDTGEGGMSGESAPAAETAEGNAGTEPAAEGSERAGATEAGSEAGGGEAAGPETAGPEAAGPEAAGQEAAGPKAGGARAEAAERADSEGAGVDSEAAAPGGDAMPGGGGGGGGGSAIADKPEPEAPDVSNAAPANAMAAMAGLPPAILHRSLSGVSEASGRAVTTQRDQLAQSPPEVQRPSGAPADHAPAANPAELASKLPKGAAGKVDVPATAKPAPQASPAPAPEMGRPPPLPSPAIPGDGNLEHQNIAAVQAAVGNLPATDPGLNVTAGSAPKLVLEGEADPNRTAEQRGKNEEATQKELQQGARDAAQPMGEDAVYPHSPAETLKAEIPQGGGAASQGAGGAAGGGAAGGGSARASAADKGGGDDAAASIIAQEQHGDEIAARVNTQSTAMRTAQDKQDADAQAEKETSQKSVDDAIAGSAQQQEQERIGTKTKVGEQRTEWAEGQSKAVTTAREKADAAGAEVDGKVATHRADGERQAGAEIAKGDTDIAGERTKAEKIAREERQKAKQESDQGFFGWIGSKVKNFFDKVKQAISDAFDAARNAIKAVIKKAQELAVAAIDAARNAIVLAIKAAGAVLMEIGNVMLAAFPELREKYKKAIRGLVDDAVKVVDALADALKKGVVALLNLLGKALDALLGVLLAALNALVDAVASYVMGVINTAKAIAQAMGAFWVLIKDIAANPGQWIRNLGAAVIDGIRNHLITAFKNAIKTWFNDTVESVIGVGKAILAVLRKGGISFAKIVKMAWEALKAAIPAMLIQLLIEKLVAMIVPAAGALMTIIEGVKAAWGSIQQIIAAFDTFMKFLKAVKFGNAGRLFAETLASAAIVVIQFVAQWLLGKLKGAGGKVGGKLREIAQKLLARVKKVGRAIGRVARRAGSAIVKGVKTALKHAKKGAKWVGAKVARVVRKIANSPIAEKLLNSPIVKKALGAVKKGVAKVKSWFEKGKKKFEDWRERKKKHKEKKNGTKRLDKAVAATRPKLHALLQHGVSNMQLRATLFSWRLRYRIKKFEISGNKVVAANSPEIDLATILVAHSDQMFRIVHDASIQLLIDPDILAAFVRIDKSQRRAEQERRTGPQDDIVPPIVPIGAGAALPGALWSLKTPRDAAGAGSATGERASPARQRSFWNEPGAGSE